MRKRIRKTIRNAFEKFLAPLRPLKNISPALFNKILKGFHRPKFAQKKSFFSPRGSAGVATLRKVNKALGLFSLAPQLLSHQSQGKMTFHGESLHAMKSKHGKNPYELSLELADKAIQVFKKSQALGAGSLKEVHAYIFGDLRARLELPDVTPDIPQSELRENYLPPPRRRNSGGSRKSYGRYDFPVFSRIWVSTVDFQAQSSILLSGGGGR